MNRKIENRYSNKTVQVPVVFAITKRLKQLTFFLVNEWDNKSFG